MKNFSKSWVRCLAASLLLILAIDLSADVDALSGTWIINENDSVAVEELSVGDNDMLSARVAALLGARLLVLLTSVDGLLAPNTTSIVREVSSVGEVMSYAKEEKGRFAIGGMASKLQAVKFAVEEGVETVIANGRRPDRLAEIVAGDGFATRFRVGS